jgi:hypothetical protein
MSLKFPALSVSCKNSVIPDSSRRETAMQGLRKLTCAQRLRLLERSTEVAEAYYNGKEADIVEGTGEVFEDGGLF